MEYIRCACGAVYNPETILICPLCMGTGKAPPSSEVEDSILPLGGRSKRAKRGKAVRGKPVAAEIRELLRVHQPSTVAKMMKGKVGRTVVYNIAREERIRQETLEALINAHGGLHQNPKSGQYRLGSQPVTGPVIYLRERDAGTPMVLPVGTTPIFVDDETYDKIMNDLGREAASND